METVREPRATGRRVRQFRLDCAAGNRKAIESVMARLHCDSMPPPEWGGNAGQGAESG